LTAAVVVILLTIIILTCCEVLAIWTKMQARNRTFETVLMNYPLTHHAD